MQFSLASGQVVRNATVAYVVREGAPARYRLWWVESIGSAEWGVVKHGCFGSQLAPLDVALGVKPHQQTSLELVQLGCLLAVFVPFQTVTVLLQRLTGVQLNQQTIWSWVQSVGAVAMRQLQQELVQLSAGVEPSPETLSPKIASMPLVIGADGVMVPMRPQRGKPDGKTLWREVKVAILVRLGHKLTRRGKNICQLHQRRLVAVLGDIDALRLRLSLEALRQGLNTARTVVWLSDGGRGFWRLYQECFSPKRDRYFRLLPCCPESLSGCCRRRVMVGPPGLVNGLNWCGISYVTGTLNK